MATLTITEAKGDRCSTGLQALDNALDGGFPRGSLVLVAGTAGSGKTTLCCHFLDAGLKKGESVIYVSLAEGEKEFRDNFCKMGFRFEKSNKLFTFMELPAGTGDATVKYIEALLGKIQQSGAKRLVVDSFAALSQPLSSPVEVRQVLHTVFEKIVKHAGVTTMLVSEIPLGTRRLGVGIEEFVSDGIILMEAKFDPSRARYDMKLKIQKMRATDIACREMSYILGPEGMEIFRKQIPDYPNKTSRERVLTGCTGLDTILGGGFLGGTMNLVSGATGSGKTVFSTQFVNKGVELEEKCLFVTYEDVPLDLIRNAEALGLKFFKSGDRSGELRIVDFNVELISFEEHTQELLDLIKSFKPSRLVVDSLSALHPSLSDAELSLFVRILRAISKDMGITTVCTNILSLLGSSEATEARLSSYFDSIILLRHVELESSMKRSLLALKMRGSAHDRDIREFEIVPGHGIKIENKFEGVENILLGSARRITTKREFQAEERRIELQHSIAKSARKRAFEESRNKSRTQTKSNSKSQRRGR